MVYWPVVETVRLDINGVSKTYGARSVLRNIAADLGNGDSLIVSGHNGSGKSTLLRLLAGLQRPSAGTVRYLHNDTSYPPAQAQHLIGLVGADVQLYRELTADEHLEFVAKLRGLRLAAHERARRLAAIGLPGRGDERVAGFSSGMQQRLRYGLALLHAPPILLLDEPTTNLDAAGIALVDELVERQRRDGIVVVATNEQRDMQYGELVLALDRDG